MQEDRGKMQEIEKLNNLLKYYKSEWESLKRLLNEKNKEIAKLKTEITKLKKENENDRKRNLYQGE